MPDIAKCNGLTGENLDWDCKFKYTCYRYLCEPSEYQQWALFQYCNRMDGMKEAYIHVGNEEDMKDYNELYK